MSNVKAFSSDHPIDKSMDLRDWFAGMALQGMWATPESIMEYNGEYHKQTFSYIAEAAYRQANEMMKAREIKNEHI